MITSLRRRVGIAMAVGATVAATVAASLAAVVAAVSLRAVEDRRLTDAALVLAAELDRDVIVVVDRAAISAVVADEAVEMHHTGIAFAVEVAGIVAGDNRLQVAGRVGCDDVDDLQLRLCRVTSPRGFVVVAADAHSDPTWLFLLAASVAAAVAALLGLLVSRPLSGLVVAPLSRLRERLASIDVDARDAIDLGGDEGIVEVDDIRATATGLLLQTREALDHARRFAADAAHELRTPLAAIGAELELLAEQEQPGRDDIARVQRLGARLQVLVERLLILATPGGLAVTEVVDVKDLLEDLLTALPLCDRERVVLDGGAAHGPVVRGDAVLLSTMFGNGIANALQHASTVVVEVRVDSDVVTVVIHDDGPGVAVADRTAVFAPFVQTMEGRRRGGHGLGLALVAHIAQLHRGAVRFVDGTGRGAHLQIDLPSALP